MKTTPLLECRHVTKVFGGGLFDKTKTIALQDFSPAIEAQPPSITAVVGESGSGKTTLARLLLGLAGPTGGEVLYNGRDLTALAGAERRQFLRDVQVIFQDPYEVYNPFYRVDHVLETPIRTDRHRVNSCYLYREAPVLPAERMDEVFVESVPAPSGPPASR